MDTRGFLQSQVYPCVWYIEDMVLLFYVDYCLNFSPSKNKIDDVYISNHMQKITIHVRA